MLDRTIEPGLAHKSMQQPADPFYAASKNALLEAVPYSMRCKTGYGNIPIAEYYMNLLSTLNLLDDSIGEVPAIGTW